MSNLNPDLDDRAGPERKVSPAPFFRGRFTKQMLMSLPEAALLLSNSAKGNDPFTPCFEGILGPVSTREELWQELRELRIAGGTFLAFVTETSH